MPKQIFNNSLFKEKEKEKIFLERCSKLINFPILILTGINKFELKIKLKVFLNPQSRGRHDIQYNDIQHNDIQHNDIQHNDIQHNGIQHNDIQHNDIQHNGIICDTQHKRLLA
jgi:hypothetical protein